MVLAVMGTLGARLLTRDTRGTDQDETTSNKIRHNEKADLCVSCMFKENQETSEVLRELLCEKWEIERV
jgi:hypothetical protein